MVHYPTPGRHLRPIPSPNGAAPHARGTFLPRSVAQRCRAARSGNISATIRHPTGHYHTLGRHFCPVPSPNSTTTHARATLTSNSVAQRCRGARSGNTSAPFRRPTVPRRTPGEHFCPIPSPGRAGQGKRTGRSEYGGRTGGRAGGRAGGRKRQRDGNGNKKRSPGRHETSGAPRGTAATYSPNWCVSTIGARGLNCSVRYGKRWNPAAKATANIT